jgi:hypothetical protein
MLVVKARRNNVAIPRPGSAETQRKSQVLELSFPVAELMWRYREDCREGTCYEGTCHGADEYAIDGKCGWQHGFLKCGGKWGSCCNMDGICGSGTDFCSRGKCQSGDCTGTPLNAPVEWPWLDGNSTDGTCGGAKHYICNPVFGYCCGSDGQCGSNRVRCGSRWYVLFCFQ